ncbi:hypothetical protein OH76DRAFT_1411175 [Lentinus brumalis]|uniref:Protein kinase domain-containing protein n=1 Tax=Lentinus brumalis TaxID=2498619 RepID=A0A371CQ35_9APHY|nr:hypothetical protein OH76DRAFT_1411175 [Polyporus brumalis]
MAGSCFLAVYCDLVGSFWTGEFDLDQPAGSLRNKVYDHSLQGFLPAGTSSAQLSLFCVEGGIEYEPEDTFRQRLADYLSTREPRKIGLLSRLRGMMGEVEEGRVYLVLGLPGRPLVTVPEQNVAKAASAAAIDSDTDSNSSGRTDETVPSEVDDTPELNHRRAVTTSDLLPVEIFGPSFAYFMGLCNTTPSPVDSSFTSLVSKFLAKVATVDLADLSQAESLTEAFVDLVSPGGEDLMVRHIPAIAYSSVFCTVRNELSQASVPLVVFKAVADPGLAEQPKVDPAMRSAIRICDNSWPTSDRKVFYRECAMPVFGVTLAGPWLRIYGSVFDHRWISQQLTAPQKIPLRSNLDISTIEAFARTLRNLRDSVAHLKGWYQHLILSLPLSRYHYRLHPPSNSFRDASGAEVKFSYLGPLTPHNNLFVAIASFPDPRTFIVKFTPAYGADAHRLLAEADLAPDLLYAGSPYAFPGYTRWTMAVMEKCDGGHVLWDVAGEPIRQQVRDAVRLLHEHGFVHGDLRSQNIMLDRSLRLRVIDFDWAGKEGTARYPMDLSPDIPWPAEARPGALIMKEHDDYWVRHVLASSVCGR